MFQCKNFIVKILNFISMYFYSDVMDSFIIPNMNFDRKLTEDSIECMDCLPLCTKTYYRVFSTNFALNKTELERSDSPLLYVSFGLKQPN